MSKWRVAKKKLSPIHWTLSPFSETEKVFLGICQVNQLYIKILVGNAKQYSLLYVFEGKFCLFLKFSHEKKCPQNVSESHVENQHIIQKDPRAGEEKLAQENVCFFFTIHSNPSLVYIAVRDLQSCQRNASVQSLLLAGHFCTTNSSQVLAREMWQTFENSWKHNI